jgi:peptidoglycan hydrolase-like protein with peptidoglycan-binding domain
MKTLTRMVAALLLLGAAIVAVPAQAKAATSSSQTACVKRTLRQGSENSCVGHLQGMLNIVTTASLKTDNDFGKKTKAAVVQLQQQERKSNSSFLVDGIVGPQTWGALCSQKTKYPDLANKVGCDKVTQPRSCNQQTFSTRTNYVHPCVSTLKMMVNLDSSAQLNPNNTFDTKTYNAVKDFQKAKKIKDDGIVGPNTWKKLCANKLPAKSSQDLYNKLARTAGCKV